MFNEGYDSRVYSKREEVERIETKSFVEMKEQIVDFAKNNFSNYNLNVDNYGNYTKIGISQKAGDLFAVDIGKTKIGCNTLKFVCKEADEEENRNYIMLILKINGFEIATLTLYEEDKYCVKNVIEDLRISSKTYLEEE